MEENVDRKGDQTGSGIEGHSTPLFLKIDVTFSARGGINKKYINLEANRDLRDFRGEKMAYKRKIGSNKVLINRMTEKLSEACMKQDLSAYRLSRLSRIPLTTILHIMDGSTRNPGFYTIAKMCVVLGLSMDEIIQEWDWKEDE